MTERTDNERLLREILAEDEPAGFREALLAQTLGLARRRRRLRQARRVVVPLVVVAGLCCWLWRSVPSTGPRPESVPSYVLVRTQPLPPGAVVETQPLPPQHLVTSTAPEVVTTATAAYRAQEITDEELLALAAPNPVILVRHGPHQAELVFAAQPDLPPSN